MKSNTFKLAIGQLFYMFLLTNIGESVSVESLPEHQTMYVKDLFTHSKAAAMHAYMNENENPCNDFYEFSCGNWMKINPATGFGDSTQTTIFDDMKIAYARKLINLLNSKKQDSSDTPMDRKMKFFFKSCVESNMNKTQLLQHFSKYGKMPALVGDAWIEKDFDWLELMARVRREYDLQLLIGLDVAVDYNNGKSYSIYLGKPNLKFSNKLLYTSLSNRIVYRNDVAWQLREYLGIPNESLASQLAEEIVGFEILLADGLPTDANIEDTIIEKTVEELQTKYGATIDFKRFFNKTIGEIPKHTVYVFGDKYIKNLQYVLESTNQRLLANYMYFSFFKEFFLPHGGTEKFKQDLCLKKVRLHFSESLENLAYRKLNIAAAEEDLKTMWIAVRKIFKSHLYSETLHWMTPAVRDIAESKLNEISMKINAYEKRNFSAEFADLVIKPVDFLENMKQILRLNTKRTFDKIHKPVTVEDNFDFSSATPFTTYTENTIKIPVVLLQPYFFWAANYPSAMKFATLGFLIARELIHSFDAKGRIYNKEGEMKNWWDEPTTTAYMVDRDCFIKQYPQPFYNNIQAQNIDAESENIADSGGLKLAYNAFIDWKRDAKLESSESIEKLPNMNYTDEQLFFLSFAQLWCNDVYPSMNNFYASRDHHLPGKFRVNGALSNAEEFSIAYNCSTESAMCPEVYCELF